jgi:hypothetical protein
MAKFRQRNMLQRILKKLGVYQVTFEHAHTGTLCNNTLQLDSQTLDFNNIAKIEALSLEQSLQLESLFGFNPLQTRLRFQCTASGRLETNRKHHPRL